MSQAKLTLRPPPNIDFVQGYPGIPPGAPDRPQAAVKGAIEVRLGPQGVKAKYVRVELRKIETIPGVPPNSYYDFVGQSPVNLWRSSEEYSMLHSQDIPFYIRIPESIPPTLALENGAGIKYELVGQVCIRSKSGFFRRNKPIILSSSTPIVVDKHELHSTWPVFQQHESRHLTQDAVMLTVDRSQNCYGPGDRVVVHATIRSDSTHATILRGFEFTLKETTIFRAGPHGSGRSGGPQVKINIIGEQKVLVNMTMYSGQVHRSELAVAVPQTHTTTTVNSARHIDITYVLVVKALMGSGKPLIMELPVIVSNWPRYVSTEAVRRIGIAPSLSLQQPVASMSPGVAAGARSLTSPATSQTATVNAPSYPFAPVQGRVIDSRLTNSMPNSASAPAPTDEMGFITRPSSEGDESQAQPHSEHNSISARRRSRTGSALPQSNRLTVINPTDNEIPEDGPQTNTPSHTESSFQTQAPRQKAWPTAEEEKARLYREATARVERVQGGLDRAESVRSTNGFSIQGSPQSSAHSGTPQADTSRWATAEEEKIRLFTQAQNNARIVQGLAQDVNDGTSGRAEHARVSSRDSSRSFRQGVGPPASSAGAALYSHAIASVHKPSWGTPVITPSLPPPAPQTLKSSRLPTATEEKEMLRRYHDATSAVQRHHDANFGLSDGAISSTSSGLPHDTTAVPYPGGDLDTSGPAPDELPPPWVPSPEFSQLEGMSEKDRYRIAFEARERAATEQQFASPPPPASPTTSPPADYYTATGTLPPGVNGSDSPAVDGGLPPPWQPASPATQSGLPPHLRARSPPSPPSPIQPGQQRILSAVEEKALLKAKYEAEEQAVAASPPLPITPRRQDEYNSPLRTPLKPSPIRSGKSISRDQRQISPSRSPPPLLPRPPASYIRETAEEDARLQDELANGKLPTIAVEANGTSTETVTSPMSVAAAGASVGNDEGNEAFGLSRRPTLPFSSGWGSMEARNTGAGTNVSTNGIGSSPPSTPPPRPPKVPLEY